MLSTRDPGYPFLGHILHIDVVVKHPEAILESHGWAFADIW